MSSLRPLALTALALGLTALRAEEGMWTFDHPPLQAMQARYGFAPDQAWLDHVRLSTVRFPGGTGSFVSPDGLILTNHHVGHDAIQLVSREGRNLVRDGFVAKERSQELRVPDLALRCLVAMENCTENLARLVPPGAPEAEAARLKKEALAGLVKTHAQKDGLEWESVILYQGGETWLYGYKVFKDVRLVMAPEFQVAAFGGDWDNFTFPRHDLDFSLFRVYENGKPYRPGHHLAWAPEGIKAGDLTCTIGHPGRTSRLETCAQMAYARDVVNPMLIRVLERRERTLRAFARLGPDKALKVSAQLMGAGNSLKVYRGEQVGLADLAAMAGVEAAERELKAKVQADPALQTSAGKAWDTIQATLAQRRSFQAAEVLLLHRSRPLLRGPLEQALDLWRGKTPKVKPLDPEVETLSLAQGLADAVDFLGEGHPVVASLLDGLTPERAAGKAIAGTRIADPAFVEALLEGGPAAREASTDPLLRMARALDAFERDTSRQRTLADATIQEWNTRIAQARFAVRGKIDYPDATFTLRLSYGSVETYPEAGTLVQPFTTLGGLFDRADGWGPQAEEGVWALPERWRKARKSLDLSTPYNFISSNDIIGGNSGSPVVNRKGELVGLAFDGNIHSLPGRYYYNGRLNRCLSVDARAIQETLRKVYDADHLADELSAGKR